MCGIAGIINLSAKSGFNLSSSLLGMTDTLKHRGPDDEGFIFVNDTNQILKAGNKDTPEQIWNSNFYFTPTQTVSEANGNYKIGLGHRRLSIIDTSPAGHQPMSYLNDKFWIVFNGEIYNYLELKKELTQKGHSFVTHTDTEVIMAGYKEWGHDVLNRLNGMWAFVIYDKEKEILFGARDRFGVKPLYYFLSDELFSFASEQKALVNFTEKKINKKAAFDYLVLGKTEIGEQSLFEGIQELAPSYQFVFSIKEKRFTKEKYYELKYKKEWSEFDPKKFSDAKKNTKELLIEAVRKRLRSDAALGSCLSGGVDSSSLVCIVNELISQEYYQQIGNNQNVFTASFPGSNSDESKWARKVVEKTKMTWHNAFPDSHVFKDNIENLIYAQDIPFPGASTFSQYWLMKKVNEQGIKVTLDGQGADELFSGYAPHFVSYFSEAAKNFSFNELRNNFKNIDSSFANTKNIFLLSAQKLISQLFFPYFKIYGFKNTHPEFSYINSHLWNTYNQDLYQLTKKHTFSLNELLQKQFTGPDLKVLLRTADRNSMAYSVESRMPFADDIDLIEYVFNLPSSFKIQHAQSKYLLREAMKGILPDEIINRKDKLGFATPQKIWLKEIKNDLKPYINSELDEYIDSKALLKNWDQVFEKSTANSGRLWRIICFAIWKKVYRLS